MAVYKQFGPSTWGLLISNTETLILISLKNDQFIQLSSSILENKQKCLKIQSKKKCFMDIEKQLKNYNIGAPGWLSWLSISLQLRS